MKKNEIVARRTESLMLASIWLGELVNVKMLRDFNKQLDLPNLKKLHLDLISYIDPDGTTITEIARRKGVTKQSISKTVQELLDMGFLEARTNPQDSRSKLISFNLSKDSAMLKGFEVMSGVDQAIAKELGAQQYASLLEGMQRVMQKLESEDPAWSLLTGERK
ncbi:MAG: MarR family transcriptional regulator [Salinisphaeraceae bacterium]|nr:MarR family transcriptional regulator [Salinisphaeraceae bacterium]